MRTELHWVDGPWPGRLAIAARPRGGDWLEDEMADWHHSGVDTVLSLLSPDEEHTLGLDKEQNTVREQDMDFISLQSRTAMCLARRPSWPRFWSEWTRGFPRARMCWFTAGKEWAEPGW